MQHQTPSNAMCDSAPVSPGPDVPDTWFKNVAKAYWDHDIHDDDAVPPWQLSGDLAGYSALRLSSITAASVSLIFKIVNTVL